MNKRIVGLLLAWCVITSIMPMANAVSPNDYRRQPATSTQHRLHLTPLHAHPTVYNWRESVVQAAYMSEDPLHQNNHILPLINQNLLYHRGFVEPRPLPLDKRFY